ncbi:helix-turn-helix domain-containing protein [Cloacibacterium sp.]|uniref:helix-turn-helix domain-containing protein n=1 Tax=Cloacibacterium sp. TaxID=1913682 RepID=UPI0039E5C389
MEFNGFSMGVCVNLIKKLVLFGLCLLIVISNMFCLGQKAHLVSYESLKEKYDGFDKNNAKALPFVNKFILKAKNEVDYSKLVEGYQDAIYFEKNKFLKLKYADSALIAAHHTKESDLITSAYLGKGIIYYSNFRKYMPALNEYLKAYSYVKQSDNQYLNYKVIYHIGVVKSYLGYYQEAILHFNGCIKYFESNLNRQSHPNEIYNYRKGYLNSIHQALVCYRNLKEHQKSDSLIELGLKNSVGKKDFVLEYNYFLKSKGISEYYAHHYPKALQYLNLSLKELKNANDFSWVSVNYFFQGKSLMALNKMPIAINKFESVDSIFNKNQFILPELRNNYELLIDYYKKQKNDEKQLYYMNQLLKADSIIGKDFIYLSTKIHKDYDTNALYEEKIVLEKDMVGRNILLFFLVLFSIVFLILFITKYRKEKMIQSKYEVLQKKLSTSHILLVENDNLSVESMESVDSDWYEFQKKEFINQDIVEDVLNKLKNFENNNGFLKKGITLNSLASNIGTNTKYLSWVINEYKKMNFTRYINTLRIYYMTRELYNNTKYHHFTIEALAEECGFLSRQNFSNMFFEINGIRPKDFIRKRIQELKNI